MLFKHLFYSKITIFFILFCFSNCDIVTTKNTIYFNISCSVVQYVVELNKNGKERTKKKHKAHELNEKINK